MREDNEYQNTLYKYKSIKHNDETTMEKKVLRIQNIVNEYRNFKIKHQQTELIEASNFNVFDILWISSDEVRHSAFLRELLDPDGSHGQGSLFLKGFLTRCVEQNNALPFFQPIIPEIDKGKWVVIREHATSQFGRMDIVLLNSFLGVVIVIENKINAMEQTHQLESYSKWLTTIEKDYPLGGLVFLTPSGYQSVTAGEFPYITLSYKKDVQGWLISTLPSIQAQVVKSTLEQYIHLIARL